MSSTISQLSCFSSMNRSLHLHPRSIPSPTLRSKLSIVMNLEGRDMENSTSEAKTTLSYTAQLPNPYLEGTEKSAEYVADKIGMSEPVQKHGVTEQKRAAKIHDFCLGIPFGGLVLSGGLVGFIFSREPTSLITGVFYGGALLALSIFSLKIWRQGKSSLPFILGQAVLSVALLWKNIQTYSLTKKIFPVGFNAVISAAMLCFYSYVVISGGNPPPKKLKSSASQPS